jgi:hypothetical protein
MKENELRDKLFEYTTWMDTVSTEMGIKSGFISRKDADELFKDIDSRWWEEQIRRVECQESLDAAAGVSREPWIIPEFRHPALSGLPPQQINEFYFYGVYFTVVNWDIEVQFCIEKKACEACKVKGWLLCDTGNDAAPKFEVQRCDVCKKFNNDDEARKACISEGITNNRRGD